MSGAQNFWTRRRAQVEAEARAEQSAAEAAALAEEHAQLEEQSDDEILAKLNLPDPETLRMGDDFKLFMSKAVPDRIRRRALRTLWRSNPVLANLDAMVDYGEDFTDSAMAVENIQTAYQVGKGMLKHVEEMARQAEARENPPEPEPELEPEIEAETPPEAVVQASDEDAVADQATPAPEAPPEHTAFTSTPRRMKFITQGTAA